MDLWSDHRVVYLILWNRLSSLLRTGHTIGERLNLGQGFHDFIALGGGASATALRRLDHEWYFLALSHYGSREALDEELHRSAVSMDDIDDELVSLVEEVGTALGTEVAEWRHLGNAGELLISGAFGECIAQFVSFYENSPFVSTSLRGMDDKLPSLRASIHYYQYRCWCLVNRYLIDRDLNRGKKLPGELVEYSSNRRAILRDTIPAALERANGIVWKDCPPLPQGDLFAELSRYLGGAK